MDKHFIKDLIHVDDLYLLSQSEILIDKNEYGVIDIGQSHLIR